MNRNIENYLNIDFNSFSAKPSNRNLTPERQAFSKREKLRVKVSLQTRILFLVFEIQSSYTHQNDGKRMIFQVVSTTKMKKLPINNTKLKMNEENVKFFLYR